MASRTMSPSSPASPRKYEENVDVDLPGAARKSSQDLRREKAAHFKAKKKLDALHAGEKHKYTATPKPETKSTATHFQYSAEEDHETHDVLKKSSEDLRREKASHFKAKKKLDALHAGEKHKYAPTLKPVPGSTAPQFQYDEEDNGEIPEAARKSSEDLRREKAAHFKAQKKLDALHAGEKHKYAPTLKPEPAFTAPQYQYDEEDNGETPGAARKSSEDLRREKAAHFKAKKKLDALHAGEKHKYMESLRSETALKAQPYHGKVDGGLAVAMTRSSISEGSSAKSLETRDDPYAGERQSQRAQKASLIIADGTKLEKLATGRKHILTAEDVRDPETVAGMKCQLDVYREKEAEEKALQLVNKKEYSSSGIV